ncbi:threonine/homoserine efflux transporter RhtA [Frondihabitans sp. PhB188]|uniref:DMT family transporter n=1 Tax=Frondihabitans sp. PhB188 TaxID=2485200 RepID=UPI000F4841A8|nr:DMT family transporter [Frondihabitans sp. PhB188]ROQ38706.1 threonine/homoserine efflux transporter RhtA [Frondihabitans sp. PhB188]
MLARLLGLRVDGLLLLVALVWGSTYLVAKELVGPDTVLALLAVRMLVAAPLMVGAVVMLGRRSLPTRAEWGVGVVLGALLSAVFLLETFGIAHTSATNAGVIISLTIVFTPLLESAVARVALPGRFSLAALGALAGVVLLTSGGALSRPSLGDGLVLGAAVVRAVHVTTMHRLTRRSARPLDSATLTAVQLATCAAVFAAASALVGQPVATYVGSLTTSAVALLLYLALVCTVFAFFVQMWAVRRTSPTRVSLLLGTEPVWAALIGAFVARDALGPVGWAGVVVILVATAWGRRVEGRRVLAAAGVNPPDRPVPAV